MKRCRNKLSQPATAENFNKESCVDANTEILIVGTITPPDGVKKGYFYSAPRNRIYGYIDDARRSNKDEKLKELKNGLPLNVSEIKRILQEEKIAFLDVMKEVVRPNSYLDDDIEEFTLDIEKFQEVFSQYKNIKKVICNSRLAESCYIEITEKLKEVPVLPKEVYCAQRGRGDNAKKEHWIKNLTL